MKTKILLVEDEQLIRDTLTELLILNNYEVIAVENGVIALQTLKYNTPDLIISDIMMPYCNGYDFYKLLRENPKFNSIPFIFLTAKKPEEELNEANMIGVDAFVNKPFKTKELISIIETKINRNLEIKNEYNLLDLKFDDYLVAEIYSPLNRIKGVTSHLVTKYDKPKEYTSYLQTIKESSEKLDRTLNNIIIYQKLMSDSYHIQKDNETDVELCFKEIYINIPNVEKNRINVYLKKSKVQISRIDLLFVMYEIIDNAIKYSSKKEKITVRGMTNTKTYTIKIKDSGIGMTEKQIDQIGPFVQFYKKKEEKHGLGLGLFLSKKIIEHYNGKLSIHSVEGQGTEVSISIPIII
jgi:signal transduction histidine kinase